MKQLPVISEYDTLTLKEIANFLGFSERAVQLRAAKEKWPFVEVPGRGRGGKVRQFPVCSLPDTVRHKVKLKQVPTCIEPATPAVVPQTRKIPDKNIKIGLAKYRLVHSYRDHTALCKHGTKAAAEEAFLLAYNSGALLPDVHLIVGDVKPSTLRRADKKLRDAGDDYTVLCDGRGGWMKYGTTKWRARKLSREAQTVFLRCYLHPSRPSISMAVRATKIILKKMNHPLYASDATFRRWFKEDYAPYNGHLVTLAREGLKPYIDKHARYADRDAGRLEVGDVLVADGKTLNFQILHPDTGRPVRMCLIIFEDWASRAPVGWQIMPTENTEAIQAAFFHACQALGKAPKVVYADNGKAFKSKVFINSEPDLDELAGLYARVGTAFQAAKPYWGRSKIVERLNLTFQEQLECLLPSFVGDSIATKPAWMHRNETFHKKWHQARTGGWIPTVREAAVLTEAYFSWYVQQPHEGLNGQRPAEILQAGMGPGIDVDAFRREFLWRFKTTPRRCRITRWGIDYKVDFLEGWSEEILVMYDTANMERLYCYDLDKNYLGDAVPVEALHPMAKLLGTGASMEQLQGEMKRQRRMVRQAKEDLLAIGGTEEDVESLNALPWNRKVAVVRDDAPKVLPAAQQALPESTPELPEVEKKRLKQVLADAQAANAMEKQAEAERPELFMTDREHYDWAFRAVYQERLSISDDDKTWMAWFETTTVFREKYQRYYADLKGIYANTPVAANA